MKRKFLYFLLFSICIILSFFLGFYFNENLSNDSSSNISNSCIDNSISSGVKNNISVIVNNISNDVNISIQELKCGDNICSKTEARESFCELDCGELTDEDLEKIAAEKISYSK